MSSRCSRRSGTALNAEVDEVTVPGLAGEFGVLPGHTPFLTALKAGVLSWRGKGGRAARCRSAPATARSTARTRSSCSRSRPTRPPHPPLRIPQPRNRARSSPLGSRQLSRLPQMR